MNVFKRGNKIKLWNEREVIVLATFQYGIKANVLDINTRRKFAISIYEEFEFIEKLPFVTGTIDGYNAMVIQDGKKRIYTAGCRVLFGKKEVRYHWANKNGYHFSNGKLRSGSVDEGDIRKKENIRRLAKMLALDEKLTKKLT